MPEMGGVEATQIIRKELPVDRQPKAIIALTADSSELNRTAYLAAGMCDVLTKPYVDLVSHGNRYQGR